ncbi:MAG: NTP transferase domain-containing protein [Chloroflexi bacterium]|nr:NTP transferase domain-containing protein [Chloroflexota bacterium]
MNGKMIGVILAAGQGSRIEPLSIYRPKPLLPVCNKPILQYQLEDMRRIGIREVILVVGHLKEGIVSRFGDGAWLGMHITYVEQKEKLGIAHAVGQLEPYVNDPFLLFLGDIFMAAPRLHEMVEMFWERRAGAVLAVKREADPARISRNFAVVVHPSGIVTRVIEKPRCPPSNLKGCGIYAFDLSIFDAIRRTPRTAQRDEYELTNSIQILIDDGYPVYPAEVVDMDVNVTVAKDLLECNLAELQRLGVNAVIGEGVTLAPGARVQNSVLGDGVVVKHPILVQDSLILSGTVVDAPHDLVRQLVTPEVTLDLRETAP